MKKILIFLIRVFLYWMAFFFLSRLFFYTSLVLTTSDTEVNFLLSVWNGLKLDLSMSGYLSAISAVVLAVFVAVKKATLGSRVVLMLNRVLAGVIAIFFGINARMYKYWGYHLEASIIDYLKTPDEAMASVSGTDWVYVILYVVFLIAITWFILSRIHSKLSEESTFGSLSAGWAFLFSGVMILPIRGGLGVAPLSVSSAFFSSNTYENHVAVNPLWNMAFSLMESKDESKLDLMSIEQANAVVGQLYGERDSISRKLDLPPKTNVVLIVLESFTANVVGELGGIEGVTPQLNKWISRGIAFDHFYSSGDRSDRGLTTLFTGFPSIPTVKLLSHPNKLHQAPNLFRDFNENGYHTSFYYGGNLEFANMKLLFSEGEVNEVISDKRLPKHFSRGRWGVGDGDLYGYFFKDIEARNQPFMATLYTLSSHEPFDIPPVSYQTERNGERFYQGIYYADSCFGAFMDQLQNSPLWGNTLVVVTADHGVKKPDDLPVFHPEKFRVPLLFTGGVVDSSARFHHCASQTDVAYTLLYEVFGQQHDHYKYSKSVFDEGRSFAQYFYHLGTGIVRDQNNITYDFTARKLLLSEVGGDSLQQGMVDEAFGTMQAAMFDFENLNRSVKRSPALKEQGK